MIAIGSTVGNYEVIAKIGSGAMGSVFLAEHPSIGKRVALKVIHADLAANAEMVSRFFTEARAVAQIANEHIIDVQNFGQTPDGDNFIIMEFLDGKSLGARLKAEVFLPLDVALHIAWQVADGLAASHARGIIHRDLKPDNIFLVRRAENPDFVKILDFGLAKLTHGGGALQHKTQAGSVLGTPHYMAPEQCEGKPDIDHRVDVYALGCIMYEMLCGRVPFPGEGFGEVLVKHLREPPPMPTRHNPSIPKAVEKIILHALAKKKEFRFADMAELRAAIGDPDGYNRVLEGDRPMGITTLEMLAQSPIRNEQATMLADAPEVAEITDVQPPAHADLAGATVVEMPAPELPEPIPTPNVTQQRTRPSGSGTKPLLVAMLISLLLITGAAATYLFVLKPRRAVAQVVVTTDPLGAEVIRGDETLGATPYVLRLPASGPPVPITLRKRGFLDARHSVAPDGDPAIVIKLVPREDDTVKTVRVEAPPPPRPDPPKKAPAAVSKKVVKPVARPRPAKPGKERFDDDVLEPTF